MKKKLMDYIREEGQCNYYDLYDYFKDINGESDSDGQARLKANNLGNLIVYIANKEIEEEMEEQGIDSFSLNPDDAVEIEVEDKSDEIYTVSHLQTYYPSIDHYSTEEEAISEFNRLVKEDKKQMDVSKDLGLDVESDYHEDNHHTTQRLYVSKVIKEYAGTGGAKEETISDRDV